MQQNNNKDSSGQNNNEELKQENPWPGYKTKAHSAQFLG